MLRIYFTADDVARTRLALATDPLWELVMSVQMLSRQPGDLLFNQWRRSTVARLRSHGDRDQLRLLLRLAPPVGFFPDFLTPIAAQKSIEHGLEAIRSTPRTTLQAELRKLALGQKLPPQVGPIARADAEALNRLAETMESFYSVAVKPHLNVIHGAVDQDRARRLNAMATGGTEGLLRSLSPMAVWQSGELQIPAHRDQEIYLGGRGLVLIPSYFCLVKPLTLFNPDLPPVLIYPVHRPHNTIIFASSTAGSRNLGPLLGQTRATVMRTLQIPRSTNELASVLGVSASNASEHTAVLRAAGLVTSQRDQSRMVHQLTSLGESLLAND